MKSQRHCVDDDEDKDNENASLKETIEYNLKYFLAFVLIVGLRFIFFVCIFDQEQHNISPARRRVILNDNYIVDQLRRINCSAFLLRYSRAVRHYN